MKSVIDYLKSEESKVQVVQFLHANTRRFHSLDTEEKVSSLVRASYNQLIAECVRENQYSYWSNEKTESIQNIYQQLILALRRLSPTSPSLPAVETIVSEHRERLIVALSLDEEKGSAPAPCAEYTGEFQAKVLRLQEGNWMQPMMDIGCGLKQELVQYLSDQGYEEVYGLDLYQSEGSRSICGSWLDVRFQENSWGCVLSHMAFSNHLRRAQAEGSRLEQRYEEKYLEILASLKKGGTFIYSPALRHLEERLSREHYRVTYYQNLSDRSFDTVHITRLA